MRRRILRICLSFAPLSVLMIAGCRGPLPSSPLGAATWAGDTADVAALLDAGADPNEVDAATVMTPLAMAARAGHTGIIRLLVRRGADPERVSGRARWTPLLHAIHRDQLGAVRALLDTGADVNGAVGWGFTPLFAAVGNGNLPIVETLLQRGADPHARMRDGTSVFTVAVSGGALTDIERPLLGACHTDIVKALLARAPDLRLESSRRSSVARWFARLNSCDEVLRLATNRPQ